MTLPMKRNGVVAYELMVPRHRRSTISRRAFSVAGLMEWNSLPHSVRDPARSTDGFRSALKTTTTTTTSTTNVSICGCCCLCRQSLVSHPAENTFAKFGFLVIYHTSFFIFVTTIGLNIIFGIIVDTFSELRNLKVGQGQTTVVSK